MVWREPDADPEPSPFVAAEARTPARLSVVYDFETTGLGKTNNIRVTQIGAQCLDGDLEVISTFTRFVNPLCKITNAASKISGISNERVRDLPDWSVVGKDFAHWVSTEMQDAGADDVTLIAHNGKVYDARILVFENARHQITTPCEWHHCDSIPVFKAMFPGQGSYSLGKLYASVFGAGLSNAHTADADCAAIGALLRRDAGTALELIKAKRESFSAVGKRCFKN